LQGRIAAAYDDDILPDHLRPVAIGAARDAAAVSSASAGTPSGRERVPVARITCRAP